MQVISRTGIVPVSIVTWFLLLIFRYHIFGISHTYLIYDFPLAFLSSSHLTLSLNFYCFPKTLASPLSLDSFFFLFTYNFVISSFQIHEQELQEEAAPVNPSMTCGTNSLGSSASYPLHYEKNIRQYLEGNFLFRYGYRAACLPITY